MASAAGRQAEVRSLVRRLAPMAVATAALSLPPAAQAEVGPGFLLLPDGGGAAKEAGFSGWVRTEGHYWTERPVLREIRGIQGPKEDLLFTWPQAPARGPEVLALAVDKASPDLPRLMALCRSGAPLPTLDFAEASETSRHPQEHGPRPKQVPAFFRYRLTGVTLACPVVDGAPEQAFRLRFAAIEWLNGAPRPAPMPIAAGPILSWKPALSGRTLAFAVSWFAAAVEARPDQCPVANTKPAQADFYALLPAAEAERIRAEVAAKGGVGPDLMPFRGPDRMHVTLLPGIVAAPRHVAPVADNPPGFDLDGQGGVDNRLFAVEGCVEGFRRRGFLPMIFNEGRAVGRPTMLVEISGIDDLAEDDDVRVSILYSTDELRRGPGKAVLPDYTFRVTGDPAFAQDFASFRGRIKGGVLVTEPIDRLHVHEVTGIETTVHRPRLSIEFLPDGRMKGLVGGYLDWRRRYVWQTFRASDYENTIGMQAPAIYVAMKQAADGLPDPVTGEFNGISAAFEIEGVPAFTAAAKGSVAAR